MVGFMYKGNDRIARLFDKRLSETFGYKVTSGDFRPKKPLKGDADRVRTNSGKDAVYRYLCIDSNRMLFSHNIMRDGVIVPQQDPGVNFYITVNVKNPQTLELVKDVRDIQEIWHDFGLCPENDPIAESTKLAFDLFDSRVSYPELNDEIKSICGGESDFFVKHNKWGGGFVCYYKDSPCSLEDLFSIFQ